ncbi:unnamed protein product [Dicrocoelium dendriticum]|nr:unnamed protein product [Dicrocoelium dendriticum]
MNACQLGGPFTLEPDASTRTLNISRRTATPYEPYFQTFFRFDTVREDMDRSPVGSDRLVLHQHLHQISPPGLDKTRYAAFRVAQRQRRPYSLGPHISSLLTTESSVPCSLTYWSFSESSRLARIQMDIVGPLPPSNGIGYLLTIIDPTPTRNTHGATVGFNTLTPFAS